jgi:ABC-type transporter Mla maintaining outer membrane lipid asymmetry ATPase subunit MlaF
MQSFSLRSPESGASCDIELGRGLSYAIETAGPDSLDALLDQLLEIPATEIAHGVGGMISNINILENIALPAVYHGHARSREFDAKVIEAFAACEVDSARAEELCGKRPGELGPLDKRLAGFVRCLLMHPDVLVYSRFLEGLTHAEAERAAALNSVYRAWKPAGTSIYLMLSDMPELQPKCDRRHVT